jgi:hypothetical protein
MGKTALMICAEQDHGDIALLLLKNAATLHATDDYGRTALHYCCRNEDEDPDDEDFDISDDIDIDDPPEGNTALAIEMVQHAKKRSVLCCRLNCRQISPPYLSYRYSNSIGPDKHCSFCSLDCKDATTGSDLAVYKRKFIDIQDSLDNCHNTALHDAVQRGT